MTRKQFVEGYAERSGLDATWAGLGIIDTGGRVTVALPCGCNHESCDGWAMVSAESVHDHLMMSAPAALREAYRLAVAAAGGK